jgi:hypothetical protein
MMRRAMPLFMLFCLPTLALYSVLAMQPWGVSATY